MIVTSDSFAYAWFELLGKLCHDGQPVSPRDYETHELLGVQVRINDMTRNILVHPARAMSYRFLCAEWLWIAAGRNDVAGITRYNKNIAQFSDDGIKFNGAYGPRMAPQMPWLLEQLKKPGSRQCVVSIWTPTPEPSRDIPCTLTWQLFVRDDKLHAIVNMRSSDVWLGLPYDVPNFSLLTNGVAGELGLVPGELVFNLGSSHLYDRDREKAGTVLAHPELLGCVTSPRLPSQPPADDVLAWNESLAEPWATYRDVLRATTQAEALMKLRTLEEK
jgi:thymidylate synthase